MRSTFFILFLGFIAFEYVSAQPANTVDSIKTALNGLIIKDSNRLNLFLKLAKITDSDSEGVKAAEEAVNLAKALNLKSKLGEGYILQATNTLELGNDTLALSLLNEALVVFQNLKDKIGEGKVYTGLARVFQYRDQYFKALEYNQKALAVYESTNTYELIGRANLDIAVNYYLLSDYVKANQYYLIAKGNYEKKGMLKEVSIITANLAQVERKLKKYTSAIAYYRSAISLQNEIKDSFGLAKSLQGIGIVYDLLKNSDSALWYYYQALAINKLKNNKLYTAENLNNIGITYKDMGRYTDAYIFMKEALQLYRELKRTMNMHQTESNIGELFCNAPDSFFSAKTIPLSQRYIKARLIFNNIISFAKETENTGLESSGWLGLSEMYKKQQDYKNAFFTYQKYVKLQDSIVNEEKVEATTKNNIIQIDQIEFEKKEAVIKATHQAEIKQQKTVKNALAAGASVLAIGGLISFLFYKRKRDAVQRQKEAEFKTEVSETEMKALRSQMNPHFIFNSLNSIGDYIAKNNTKLADEYLAKFAKLMRLILENSEKKEVLLSEDLKALELYMQLECLRMNQKFTYQVKVDEGINTENTLVPPLILQPFVENSIWHGIAKKEGRGNILVHIKKEGEMINCVIEDDGIGREQAARQVETSKTIQKQSLGMKITRARINILNKVKNSTADIQLFDLSHGTRVEVKLPLELSF